MDKRDKIRKEIEQKLSRYEKKYEELARYEVWITAKEIEQRIKELKEVLLIIDTLEVKEVDDEPECKIFPRPVECYSTCKDCSLAINNKAQK